MGRRSYESYETLLEAKVRNLLCHGIQHWNKPGPSKGKQSNALSLADQFALSGSSQMQEFIEALDTEQDITKRIFELLVKETFQRRSKAASGAQRSSLNPRAPRFVPYNSSQRSTPPQREEQHITPSHEYLRPRQHDFSESVEQLRVRVEELRDRLQVLQQERRQYNMDIMDLDVLPGRQDLLPWQSRPQIEHNPTDFRITGALDEFENMFQDVPGYSAAGLNQGEEVLLQDAMSITRTTQEYIDAAEQAIREDSEFRQSMNGSGSAIVGFDSAGAPVQSQTRTDSEADVQRSVDLYLNRQGTDMVQAREYETSEALNEAQAQLDQTMQREQADRLRRLSRRPRPDRTDMQIASDLGMRPSAHAHVGDLTRLTPSALLSHFAEANLPVPDWLARYQVDFAFHDPDSLRRVSSPRRELAPVINVASPSDLQRSNSIRRSGFRAIPVPSRPLSGERDQAHPESAELLAEAQSMTALPRALSDEAAPLRSQSSIGDFESYSRHIRQLRRSSREISRDYERNSDDRESFSLSSPAASAPGHATSLARNEARDRDAPDSRSVPARSPQLSSIFAPSAGPHNPDELITAQEFLRISV